MCKFTTDCLNSDYSKDRQHRAEKQHTVQHHSASCSGMGCAGVHLRIGLGCNMQRIRVPTASNIF